MLLRFGGVLFIVVLVIWLYCLLDAITSNEAEVRSLPKVVWVLIVLFTFEIGAVLWLAFGRPRRSAGPIERSNGTGRYEAWQGRVRPGGGGGGRSGRPAPDDDPEFLAGLSRRANDEHKQLLDQWEADLRRREEELRRREEERPDTGRESGRETSGRDAADDGPDEPTR